MFRLSLWAMRCLFALAVVCGMSRLLLARERGPRVEITCPSDPIPVRIAGDRVLAYELHITNFDKVSLTITRVDVFGDSEQDTPLFSATGTTLEQMVANIGAARGEKPSVVIAPGKRTVLFLWVAIESDKRLPGALKHRILFQSQSGSGGSLDSLVDATLQDFPVFLSSAPVPIFGSPFRDGVWVAGDGPSNDSPHRRSLLAIAGHVRAPERFASDWVRVGPNGNSRRGHQSNEEYWDYDEPILAVADGVVTEVVDGIPDNLPGVAPKQITLDNLLGNHIILRIGPHQYVTYAHLKPGSIKVAVNSHVIRGTIIGHLGDSGQSTGPHLHLQVTDGPSGLESEGVPFVFKQFTDLGSGADYEPSKHSSTTRTYSLPGENEVITFGSN